jgi:hypothetical protein
MESGEIMEMSEDVWIGKEGTVERKGGKSGR